MKNEHGLTQQRERYAHLLAEGMTQADAYRGAFKASKMKPAQIHEEASRIAADPKVAARVAQLQAQVAEKSILKAVDILEGTRRIAMATPAGLVKREKGADGKPQLVVLMPDELPPEIAAAVASFEIDELGRVKYKFWDKNVAQERATKILGLYSKDNAQKAGLLAELWARLSGDVVKPDPQAAEPDSEDEDD